MGTGMVSNGNMSSQVLLSQQIIKVAAVLSKHTEITAEPAITGNVSTNAAG